MGRPGRGRRVVDGSVVVFIIVGGEDPAVHDESWNMGRDHKRRLGGGSWWGDDRLAVQESRRRGHLAGSFGGQNTARWDRAWKGNYNADNGEKRWVILAEVGVVL